MPPAVRVESLRIGGRRRFGINQAESVVRPLFRLRARMRRPPRVFIRRRNPCVFFLLRLFGWYVRFNVRPLELNDHGAGPPIKDPHRSGEYTRRRLLLIGAFAPPGPGPLIPKRSPRPPLSLALTETPAL